MGQRTTRRTALSICLSLAALLGMAACSSATSRRISLPTPTAFNVSLTPDRTTYSASQPIGVTVQNASASAYYAADAGSVCTIVTLQELVKGVWQTEMPCTGGQPPTLLLIAPHSSVPFTLAPGNASGDPNAWDPGIYRLSMTVSAKPDGSEPRITVYSAGFRVNANSSGLVRGTSPNGTASWLPARI